jgi:N-dimethylarginine dimethylaminohydrolase
MVFTANAGLVVGDTFVPGRFRYPQRAGEEPAFTNWAERAGFRVVPLPAGIAFEGAGDALFDRRHPILWMGHGFRTDPDAAGALGENLDGKGVRILPLRLIDPRFYHLDTCFCPLTGGSILYYPAAFAPESRALLEDVVPARERIPVSDSDAAAFACNAVNLDQKIVLNAATETLRSELQGRGFEVFETSLEDFLCAGGAAKCLTLRLDEHLSCEPEPGDFTGVMARIP